MERLRAHVGLGAIASIFLFVLSTEPATGQPALSLHFGPVSHPACEAIDTATLTCENIDVEGAPRHEQRVYVLASGVEVLDAVEFGITYVPSVNVLYWQSCWGALEIPGGAWPTSDTGMAVSWAETRSASGPDSMIVLGYFQLAAGSRGVISLTVDPRSGSAAYVDPDAVTHLLDSNRLGRADAGGTGGGAAFCGSGVGWDGPIGADGSTDDDGSWALAVQVLENATLYTASQRTNVLDCSSLGIAHEPSVWTTDVELGPTESDDVPHTLRTISDGAGNDEPVMYALNFDNGIFGTFETRAGVMRTRTNGQLRYADAFDAPLDPIVPHVYYLPQRHFMEVDSENERIYYVAEHQTAEGVRIMVSAVSSLQPIDNQWRYSYHNTVVDGEDYLGGMGVRNDTLFVGGYADNGASRHPFAFTLAASSGALLGEFTYPFSSHEADIRDAALDPRPGGPFWMMGATGTLSAVPQGLLRVALDADGLTLMTGSAVFDAPDASFFPDIMAIGEGGAVAIAGMVGNAAGTGAFDLFALLLGAPGDESAYVRYEDGWAAVEAIDLQVGGAGDAYLLGAAYPPPEPPDDVELALVRIDPNGGIHWDTRLTCPAETDGIIGGALAERDLAVLLATGMPAPESETVCADRYCVNVLGLRRDTGDLFWHGLDVQPSGGRTPSVVWVGHEIDGALRVYAGGRHPRAFMNDFGVSLTAFEVTPPDVVGVSNSSIGDHRGQRLVAQQAGDALRVTITGADRSETLEVGVYDVTGRRVDQLRLEPDQATARTAPLGSGVYFLRVHGDAVNAVTRAVIAR